MAIRLDSRAKSPSCSSVILEKFRSIRYLVTSYPHRENIRTEDIPLSPRLASPTATGLLASDHDDGTGPAASRRALPSAPARDRPDAAAGLARFPARVARAPDHLGGEPVHLDRGAGAGEGADGVRGGGGSHRTRLARGSRDGLARRRRDPRRVGPPAAPHVGAGRPRHRLVDPARRRARGRTATVADLS